MPRDQLSEAVADAVPRAFGYFRSCLRDIGNVAEDADELYLDTWDSVNVLKAVALWRATTSAAADFETAITRFLRSRETPAGMVGWGASRVGAHDYCTETSAEYITSLTLLGRVAEALPKAAFLRTRQRPEGYWQEVYPHIPAALQTVPSVTGFALLALTGLGLEPAHPDEALDHLIRAQTPEGDFGINAYYCATHFYILRPIVAVLREFGHYGRVAMARDFVLDRQHNDGSWFSTTEGYEGYSSPELHTALALESLAHTGVSRDHRAVRRGVSWLLGRQQPDGSWYGGVYAMPATDSYLALKRPQNVYTTAQTLCALHHLTAQEAPRGEQL